MQNIGSNGGKKQSFLLKMKEDLGLTCDKKQLTNGFQSFINKYKEIKGKLNSSGFGVDPEVDQSLDKGMARILYQLHHTLQ